MCIVMRLSYCRRLPLFTDGQLPDLMFLRKIAEDDEMFKIKFGDGAVYLFSDVIIGCLAVITWKAGKDNKAFFLCHCFQIVPYIFNGYLFFFPYAIPTQFVKKLFELKVFYKLVKPCFVYGSSHFLAFMV